MKNQYPDYKALMRKGKGTAFIEENLKPKDKKIFQDYMIYLSMSAGKRKMIDYRLYFLQFIDIMEKPLDKLTPQDITAFWALVNHDERRLTATKNNIKVVVKRFVKWFFENDASMLKIIPNLKLKSHIVNEQRINKNNLLSGDDLELLMRTAQTLREKAQITMLYETAGRPSEIRTAKWKQVDFDDETISIYSNKTRKSRVLPVKDCLPHLKRWRVENPINDLTDEDYIFPSPKDRKKPIGEFEFGYWLRQLGKKAKLSKPLYAYIFRHSRLTELKKKGVDDIDRKMFAGHSPNSKMQSVYVTSDNDDMRDSIISKIYKVQSITPKRKHELEEKIDFIFSKLLEDLEPEDREQAKELFNM